MRFFEQLNTQNMEIMINLMNKKIMQGGYILIILVHRQRETIVSENSTRLTLVIEMCGDPV